MPKTSLIMIRIDPKDRKAIEKAAGLDRRTVSDFIRLAAIDKANEVIDSFMNQKGKK